MLANRQLQSTVGRSWHIQTVQKVLEFARYSNQLTAALTDEETSRCSEDSFESFSDSDDDDSRYSDEESESEAGDDDNDEGQKEDAAVVFVNSFIMKRIHSTSAIQHVGGSPKQGGITNNNKFDIFDTPKTLRKSESEVFQTPPPPMFAEATATKHADAEEKYGGIKPHDYLLSILKEEGKDIESAGVDASTYFLKISNSQVQAYNLQIATAARQGQLAIIQKAYRDGRYLQCCNQFGESIVHIVCRRGHVDVLKFLKQKAAVTVRVRDDLGRTPLHDAAWTDSPNFDIVKILLGDSPEFLFCKDNRGSYPLSFVPQPRWAVWCSFLDKHRELILRGI